MHRYAHGSDDPINHADRSGLDHDCDTYTVVDYSTTVVDYSTNPPTYRVETYCQPHGGPDSFPTSPLRIPGWANTSREEEGFWERRNAADERRNARIEEMQNRPAEPPPAPTPTPIPTSTPNGCGGQSAASCGEGNDNPTPSEINGDQKEEQKPPEPGYHDINVSAGCWGGVTFGVAGDVNQTCGYLARWWVCYPRSA